MPTNITDADEYTATIVAPADGDPINGSAPEEMGQGLANRTYNHKLRLDALNEYVFCTIGVDGLTTGQEGTLAIDSQSGGASIVSSTELELPSAGVWEFSVTLPSLYVSGSTDCAAYGIKGTGTGRNMGSQVVDGDYAHLSTAFVETITDPSASGDRIKVVAGSASGTLTLGLVNSGLLVARRIS